VIVLVPWLLVRIVVMDEKRCVVVFVCSDNDESTNDSTFDANRATISISFSI
jgi:hypothetical protein